MRPELTTVRQPVAEKGRAAAAALIEAIERAQQGKPPRVRHVVLPTELVVRDSTGPASDRRQPARPPPGRAMSVSTSRNCS